MHTMGIFSVFISLLFTATPTYGYETTTISSSQGTEQGITDVATSTALIPQEDFGRESEMPLRSYTNLLNEIKILNKRFGEEKKIVAANGNTLNSSNPYRIPGYAKVTQNGMYVSAHRISQNYINAYIQGHPQQVTEFRNKHSMLVNSYRQQEEKCEQLHTLFGTIQMYQNFNEFIAQRDGVLYINRYDFARLLSCYIQENNTIQQNELVTSRKEYREENIEKGLQKIRNYQRQPGETISIYEEIFDGNPEYAMGYALRENSDGVIEEFEVVGGGLCGVSTILYQSSISTKNIEITERRPHSNRYDEYYGSTKGLDATIFGNGYDAYKDLKVRNDSGQTIVIEPYHYTTTGSFNYGLRLIAPYLESEEIRTSNSYNKNGRTCVTNRLGEESVESCYVNIY